ncbi:hypothetical protein EJ06DRAFT_518974 [Trichodelitschia bisporula]|uniref:Uncharacterized protein n=1 Tax=Trichodelitschia bisporula TaxID=703511 RepID=A0A6G1I959_9PEZI|nr:hypothetical protein EJ06DRAFT_518974 [Trichodelitschia bisporula]
MRQLGLLVLVLLLVDSLAPVPLTADHSIFTRPFGRVDPNGQPCLILFSTDGLYEDCTVLVMRTMLEYPNNDTKATDTSKKPEAQESAVGSIVEARFQRTGNDSDWPLHFSSLESPFPRGFYIRTDDVVSMIADLVNYSGCNETVHIITVIAYLPAILERGTQATLLKISGAGTTNCATTEPMR